MLRIIILSCFILGVGNVNADVNITTSSIENETTPARNAFDGDMQTRWSSKFSDPQWLEIDLGEIREIVGITLFWEAAYGRSYDILISRDKKGWQKVYTTTEGDGLTDDIYFGRKKVRYIKILCKERATQWGYSLWEMRLKGLKEEILIRASSSIGADIAEKALDSNLQTRWRSADTDEVWLEMEFKKAQDLGAVYINWGEDYARTYKVEISADKIKWNIVYERTKCTGSLDKIYVNILGMRFLRIVCKDSNRKGFSMREIELKRWEDVVKSKGLDKIRSLAGWEGYRFKAFVGKDGSFAVQPYPFQVNFWVYDHDAQKLYTPETIETSWKLVEGGFPVTIVSWNSDDIESTTTIFSRWDERQTKLLTFARSSIKNNSSKDKVISLYAAIRPNPLYKKWNVEDLKEIEYDGGSSIKINGSKRLYFVKKENTPLGGVGIKEFFGVKAIPLYKSNFKSKEKRDFDIMVPSGEGKELTFDEMKGVNFDENLEYTINYWKARVLMELVLPDKRYEDCFYASIYYTLIMMEGSQLNPGPYEYTNFTLHDAVDMVNALDKVGLSEIVDRALDHFNFKEGDGYLDGLGGSIFALYEHYRMTKDKDYLERVYPRIREACRLIKTLRARQLSQELKDSPVYGLLPKSVSQDNFKIPAHLYVDNWWAIVGLKSGIEVAKILNKEEDILWLNQEYEGLLNSTLTSIEKVMKKEGLSYMPAFADYWPKEMRIVDHEHRILGDTQMAWAHRPALFPGQSIGIEIPLGLFADSYKQYWQRAGKFSGFDGGWFVEYEKVFWGYNLKLAHPLIYLGMSDVALKNIQWNIEHQTCPGGWTEAMPSKVNEKGLMEIDVGIIGDVPHGWSAAHYVLLLRDMLLREDGEKLVILSCVPEHWLDDGQIIEIKDAPTYFGKMSFKLESFIKKAGYIKLLFDTETPPPDGYVLTSPLKTEIKKVQIDGKIVRAALNRQIMFPSDSKEVLIYY